MADIVISGDSSGSVTLRAPGVSGTTILTLPTTSGTIVTTAGAASLTTSGNLTFTGTGNRILGDFSNATLANRVTFQSSTTNGNTSVALIPNGSSVNANLVSYNNSSITNSARMVIGVGPTEANITSDITGTGTFLPIVMFTGGSERLRIDTSGNVGIGTSSPSQRLHVVATDGVTNARFAGASFAVRIQSLVGVGAVIEGTNNTEATYQPLIVGGSQIQFTTSGAERMRINSSGDVLVGTSSAGGERFVVYNSSTSQVTAGIHNRVASGLATDVFQIQTQTAAGTAYMLARWYSAGVPQFAFRGDGQMFATSTSIASISDVRTKENIVTYEDGLEVINALRPVRFDFKEGFGNNKKNQLGFIAQEIETVFPDAVSEVTGVKENDEETYKTVGPATLIPVLVKAIQELNAKVTALEAQLGAK